MKMFDSCGIGRALPVLTILLLMAPGAAMAASPEWRPTYDLAMKWVNFIILVAVIVKYAREPIKVFLMQQRGEVVAEMDGLEAQKERITGEIRQATVQAAENKLRHQEMKQRLIAQGETRKQQIVEQARQQSVIMMEAARKKMENRILQAKDKLKSELADMAFEQAFRKLPLMITDQDNQRLVDSYMKGMYPNHVNS